MDSRRIVPSEPRCIMEKWRRIWIPTIAGFQHVIFREITAKSLITDRFLRIPRQLHPHPVEALRTGEGGLDELDELVGIEGAEGLHG